MGFLDALDWDHPAVQRLTDHVLERGLRKVFPQGGSDPVCDVLSKQLELLHAQQQQMAAMSGGVAVAAPAPASIARPNPHPSRYLDQEGAGEEWDTGCLGCGVAHLALVESQLAKAADEPDGSPEQRKRLAIARRELDTLFSNDWTAERIARTPPEHRRILEEYVPRVRALYEQVASPLAAGAIHVWGQLDEATRFAYEDSAVHPEVLGRINEAAEKQVAASESTAVEVERVDLDAETMSGLPSEQRDRVVDLRRQLRRLRQDLKPGVLVTAQEVDGAAARAKEIALGLQAVDLDIPSGARLKVVATDAARVREGFRASIGSISAPIDHTADVAVAVASGQMTPEQGRAALNGGTAA